jgi:hypothetical protein
VLVSACGFKVLQPKRYTSFSCENNPDTDSLHGRALHLGDRSDSRIANRSE